MPWWPQVCRTEDYQQGSGEHPANDLLAELSCAIAHQHDYSALTSCTKDHRGCQHGSECRSTHWRGCT
jgi:hypothetical protein